jgi:hypothetical protein
LGEPPPQKNLKFLPPWGQNEIFFVRGGGGFRVLACADMGARTLLGVRQYCILSHTVMHTAHPTTIISISPIQSHHSQSYTYSHTVIQSYSQTIIHIQSYTPNHNTNCDGVSVLVSRALILVFCSTTESKSPSTSRIGEHFCDSVLGIFLLLRVFFYVCGCVCLFIYF